MERIARGVIVLGLAFSGYGAFGLARAGLFVSRAEPVQGTIKTMTAQTLRWTTSSGKFTAEGYGRYRAVARVDRAVVEFRAPRGGAEVAVETGLPSGGASYGPGSAVELLCDPSDPKSAVVRSFSTVWGEPLVDVAAGLAVAVLGTFLLLSASRSR